MVSVLKSVEVRGYVAVIASAILWGTLGIFAKFSFEYGVLPEVLIALRLVISFATLLGILSIFGKDLFKIRKADALLLLILGVFATALQRITYFYAVDLTTVTVAVILFYTYPVFVALSASLFLRERISSGSLLAIILTFSGVALVVRIYDVSLLNANLAGIIFGLFSSLLFTLYIIMTKKLRIRYASWTLTLYGEGIGALTLIPVISLSFSEIIEFPLQLWLLIFVIAWIPSLLAYLLYSYALKYVRASTGSILAVMEPVSAAVFSVILIGESLEQPQMIGIALASIGVVLLLRMGTATNASTRTEKAS